MLHESMVHGKVKGFWEPWWKIVDRWNRHRAKIIQLILENDEKGLTFKDISEKINDVSQPSIMQYLNTLVMEGLVEKWTGVVKSCKGLDMPVYLPNRKLEIIARLIEDEST
jgi:Mn-dependent DtxR family transcriptional regulator